MMNAGAVHLFSNFVFSQGVLCSDQNVRQDLGFDGIAICDQFSEPAVQHGFCGDDLTAKQFVSGTFQHIAEIDKYVHAGNGLAAFQMAHVAGTNANQFSKLFLGQTALDPAVPDALPDILVINRQ